MQIFRQYAFIPKIHMLNLWITCVTIYLTPSTCGRHYMVRLYNAPTCYWDS